MSSDINIYIDSTISLWTVTIDTGPCTNQNMCITESVGLATKKKNESVTIVVWKSELNDYEMLTEHFVCFTPQFVVLRVPKITELE